MTIPTATQTTEPDESRGAGGRPRNADLDPRILEVVIDQLAENGLSAVTGDTVAHAAGCGKASIYRRWGSQDAMVAAAVTTLGVRSSDLDLGPVQGSTLRWDVTTVVRAAATGRRAAAERAVLSALPHRPDLARAYHVGPAMALDLAIRVLIDRYAERGSAFAPWPGAERIHAVVAFMHLRALTVGAVPDVSYALGAVLGEGWQ